MKEVVGIEEEVEIFCSLGKEKALHPVRQAVVANILYSSISTRSSGGESGQVLGPILTKKCGTSWNAGWNAVCPGQLRVTKGLQLHDKDTFNKKISLHQIQSHTLEGSHD